jgi:preprotein translocase subunit SecG
MIAVLLTTHVLIVLGLIGVVLLQRSEGGALGMGGGGGGGGFMTGRGAANALTRTTSILAALFFATSLGLAMIGDRGEKENSVFEELTGSGEKTAPAPPGPASTDDLLKSLGAEEDRAAPAPATGEENSAPASETGANEQEAEPKPEPDAAPKTGEEPPPPADEPNN